jgi:hypothetical protein
MSDISGGKHYSIELYLHSTIKELIFLHILNELVFEGTNRGLAYLLPLPLSSV